jgi:transposase-like protein
MELGTQQFNPKIAYSRKTRVTAFLIDETMIQIGNNNNAWLLWIAIEPIHSLVLRVYISRHRNMLIAESFLRSLVKSYGGKHSVSIQIEDHGTLKHVLLLLVLSIDCIHRLRKASSLKEDLFSISKTEHRAERSSMAWMYQKLQNCFQNHMHFMMQR